MSRELVIAQTRVLLADMEKDANFMRNTGHAIQSAAIRARGAVKMLPVRARIAKGDIIANLAMRKGNRPMAAYKKSFERSLKATPEAMRAAATKKRVSRIEAAGKGELLKRIAERRKNPGAIQKAAPGAFGGMGKKLLIGAGLLGAGAALGGAFSAGKTQAMQPMAPPSEIPQGY